MKKFFLNFKWAKDFDYFFKENERRWYLSVLKINIPIIITLFWLSFINLQPFSNLRDIYLILVGTLLSHLAMTFFEYSKDLTRRKDLLGPYLDVLDDLYTVVVSITIDIKRYFPLNEELIDESHYKALIDNSDKLNKKNFISLINLLAKLEFEQVYKNINSANLTKLCKHLTLPYEILGRSYPMFLTIADLYSKEFIGLTSKLYRHLQNIKRFCSYNLNESAEETKKMKYLRFRYEFIELLYSLLNLYIKIELKLTRYQTYVISNRQSK